jgi:hypothetical protein
MEKEFSSDWQRIMDLSYRRIFCQSLSEVRHIPQGGPGFADRLLTRGMDPARPRQ